MKRILFLTALIALLLQAPLSNFAQQTSAPADEYELVDSAAHDGFDAFSDTTAVDTGTVEIVSQQADADDYDDDSFGIRFAKKFLGTSSGFFAIFVSLMSILFVFAIMLSPLLIILLLLLLLFRKRNKPAPQQPIDNNPNDDLDMNGKKRFRRSNDRVIGGVCAGIAEYFDFDPTIVRVVYALLTFFTGFSGIPCYIILWIIMPSK